MIQGYLARLALISWIFNRYSGRYTLGIAGIENHVCIMTELPGCLLGLWPLAKTPRDNYVNKLSNFPSWRVSGPEPETKTGTATAINWETLKPIPRWNLSLSRTSLLPTPRSCCNLCHAFEVLHRIHNSLWRTFVPLCEAIVEASSLKIAWYFYTDIK